MATSRKQRKRCKCCKRLYTPTRASQLYCSDACKKASQRSTQDKDQKLLSKLSNTGFLSYLQYQSKRAGTVEIIPKKIDALVELHSIWSYANKANAHKMDKAFEIAHIHPVRDRQDRRVGTLHPSNLVVQPSSFNRSHSNRHFGHGHSVSKYRLKDEWLISADATKADILALIFKRIGLQTLKAFNRAAKPATLARTTELQWFRDKVCLVDRTIHLESLPLEDLRQLRADITNSKVFHIDFTPYREYRVVLHELQRLSRHRPDLLALHDWVASHLFPKHQRTGAYAAESLFIVEHLQPLLVGADADLEALQDEYEALPEARSKPRTIATLDFVSSGLGWNPLDTSFFGPEPLPF